jgi:PEGA domain
VRRALAFGLALGLASAAPARAADPFEQARTLYDAGARAYAAGSYAAAVQAFSEAYRFVPKPTLLFSLAQAERRRYTAERDDAALRDAIKHFRAYVEEVRQGGRRADAVEAIAELEAISARLTRPSSEAVAAPSTPSTRLLVSTPMRAAVITLDGVDHAELPLIEEVAPGKHQIRVSARGYLDEEREVIAVLGTLLPLEILLREQPSFLRIAAPAGARVTLDGRPLGEAPLLSNVEVTAGPHLVGVSKTGAYPYLASTTLELGQVASVHAALRRTGQRSLSYVFMGSAAAALISGGVLAGGALRQEQVAQQIADDAKLKNIPSGSLGVYRLAVASRDQLRTFAVAMTGVAGALGVVAAGLYAFDDPPPAAVESPRSTRAPKPTVTIGLAGAGLAVRLRF